MYFMILIGYLKEIKLRIVEMKNGICILVSFLRKIRCVLEFLSP